MIKQQDFCPFCEGDWIIHSPSRKRIDADVMSSVSEKLFPGKAYKVAEVQQESLLSLKDINILAEEFIGRNLNRLDSNGQVKY